MLEVIEASDPEGLCDLLIPGYLMSLDAKNKYMKLSQEITNQTHAELHQFYFSDVLSCAKGAVYGATGATFAYLGLGSLFSNSNFRKWRAKIGNFSFAFEPGHDYNLIEDNTYFAVSLLALASYFSYKSVGIFRSVVTKHPRLKRHYNALTIEAIIQRLPAFDNGCFVPGSLN